MLFGSFDPANAITVDKTPAALWVMSLSRPDLRLQRVERAGAAGAHGRRHPSGCCTSPCAGRSAAGRPVAGAVLALTPVAALMFRFNNPDALLDAAAGGRRLRHRARDRAALDALAGARRRARRLRLPRQDAPGLPRHPGAGRRLSRRRPDHLPPPAAPGRRAARGGHRVRAAGTSPRRALAGGVAPVHRRVADQQHHRPASSATTASAGSPARRSGASAAAAGLQRRRRILRLFGGELGSQVAGCCRPRCSPSSRCCGCAARMPRTDPQRAQVLLWGGWLVHRPRLQPHGGHLPRLLHGRAGAGDRGPGGHRRGRRMAPSAAAPGPRHARHRPARDGGWTLVLLGRSPDWDPWLVPVVASGRSAPAAGLVLLAGPRGRASDAPRSARRASRWRCSRRAWRAWPPLRSRTRARSRPRSRAVTAAGAFSGFGAPSGAGLGGPFSRPSITGEPRASHSAAPPVGPTGWQRRHRAAAGARDRWSGRLRAVRARHPGRHGRAARRGAGEPAARRGAQGRCRRYRWVAATTGSNNAAGLALSTGESVMAIGGFNGSDQSHLAQFQQWVASGAIHWYVSGGDAWASPSPAAARTLPRDRRLGRRPLHRRAASAASRSTT